MVIDLMLAVLKENKAAVVYINQALTPNLQKNTLKKIVSVV